jgi:hypothetical protein
MSLKISLETNERLIFKDSLAPDEYPYPFTFAVTDCAVFVTKERRFAKESWHLKKIPLSEIKQVSLIKESDFRVFAISGLIFIFGLILLIFMIIPYLNNEPAAQIKIMPFTITGLGLIMPFLVKKRRILVVQLKKGTYKWKPKILINAKLNNLLLKFINSSENRNRILDLQKEFLTACAKVGIPIYESED